MATSTKSAKFAVMLSVQGGQPKMVYVKSGATVRSALESAGRNAESDRGSITVNGKSADLTARISKGQYLAVTPKVAGGR